MTAADTLTIRNFAQLHDVTLDFGDLTVLVGAQGTGKSLALQWLKAALDGKEMVSALRAAGQVAKGEQELIDLIFGVGMGQAWLPTSSVTFRGRNVQPKNLGRLGDGTGKVFFVPAHRATLVSDGWAAPFQRLTSDTPVVARIFSQTLFDRFSAKGGDQLFPVDKLLKTEYRNIINDAIFHGGQISLEQDTQHAKRLKLAHGNTRLPFMTWTAGQREFTPLLLGLYQLLPRTQKLKQENIDWVVIEEPEMGLHPQAISAVMLLVLDLLWRGYRVVLSTHSPHVLTAVWMLQRLKEHRARWQLVCEAFKVPRNAALQKVAESALKKTYKVHSLEFAGSTVVSHNISALDPGADDEAESGWGGLTGFSSGFGDVVRTAVNEGPL
jgi:hypothetical protein